MRRHRKMMPIPHFTKGEMGACGGCGTKGNDGPHRRKIGRDLNYAFKAQAFHQALLLTANVIARGGPR